MARPTESALAMGLWQVIKMFVSPLRTPSGAWILGPDGAPGAPLLPVPDQALGPFHISNLFFLQLAPRLQLYQPRLVCFPAVSADINTMVANQLSYFGKFVCMQSDLPQCGRMSLTSFLLNSI
ncbi:hypothetical protein VP01_3017g6 [Puccinia sorghi]|uniref:Uncharacterized protein n=1 Tax=Puccinia sorghi TaxID=27349 RepID=A0A0L6V084_9BASI|nr:hypothetical protein VP01_3017g6 [Puccinia sorghi]